jgi:hypothetical protein
MTENDRADIGYGVIAVSTLFRILIILAAAATPAFSMGSDKPVTWLKSYGELPKPVRKAASSCSYPKEHTTEALEKDTETGGYFVKVEGGRLYVVTCELAASNAFDAAVLFSNGRARRLAFPSLQDDNRLHDNDAAGNTRLQKDGSLAAFVSMGCAGSVGVTMTYALKAGKLVLTEQQSNSDCDNPAWKVVYPAK